MRRIDASTQFKRDVKKARKQRKSMAKLQVVLELLQTDKPLAAKHRPHRLSGNWAGFWECHIEPDWLLIYAFEGEDILQLARLGSHAELF